MSDTDGRANTTAKIMIVIGGLLIVSGAVLWVGGETALNALLFVVAGTTAAVCGLVMVLVTAPAVRR